MPSDTTFSATRRLGVLATAGVTGVLCVIALGLTVRHVTSLVSFVAQINAAHSPTADAVALMFASLTEPVYVAAILTRFCCVVFWRTRHIATAIAASTVVGVTWLSTSLIKLVIDRPRPNWALITHHIVPLESNSSFPSAHVVFMASLVTAIVLLAWRSAGRYLVLGLGAAFVMTMAIARIYVGAHDPIDVFAGAVYGINMTLLCWAAISQVSARRLRRSKNVS